MTPPALIDPAIGTKPRSRAGGWVWLVLLAGFVLVIIFAGASNRDDSRHPLSRDYVSDSDSRRNAQEVDDLLRRGVGGKGFGAGVSLDSFHWASNYGTVEASFTLKNMNAYAVKDPLVRCEIYGLSGTLVARLEKTFTVQLEPAGSSNIQASPLGWVSDQGKRASCRVVSVSRE